MNSIKHIIYVSALIATYTTFGMHNMSQPKPTDAFLKHLGLQYLNEQDQEIFFDYINTGDTKSQEFKKLFNVAINKSIQKHPQILKIKAAKPIDTKAYFPQAPDSLDNSL